MNEYGALLLQISHEIAYVRAKPSAEGGQSYFLRENIAGTKNELQEVLTQYYR
jgi:hypothetical protein